MKFHKLSDREYLLLLRNEDILESLKKFAEQENITSGYFTGLGAMSAVKVSLYDFETKTYKMAEFNESTEIVSLIGNFAMMDNKPIVHAHMSVSKEDMSVVGGHVMDGCVARVGEIHIRRTDAKIERAKDEETGLNMVK